MSYQRRKCGRCGDALDEGGRNLCDPCWYAVPLALRRAYFEATGSPLGRRRATDASVVAAREAITAWVKANPVRRERREPLWRKPRET